MNIDVHIYFNPLSSYAYCMQLHIELMAIVSKAAEISKYLSE